MHTSTSPSRGPSAGRIAAVAAIIVVGLVLTAFTSDVTRVSEAGIKLVDDRPYLIEWAGDWVGGPLEGLSEAERKILPVDTQGVRRSYIDNRGNEVFCSIILAGRDVTSIHRPQLCLTGQGWLNQGQTTEQIPTSAAPGGVLTVTRMNEVLTAKLHDGRTLQSRAIFAYWFVGKDRLTPHHWQRILWTSEDRIFHNTNHRWAYFLIQVPVVAGRTTDEVAAENKALEILRRFVRDIYPTVVTG